MSLPPCKKPADLIGENGPRKRLNKSVIEPKWPSIRDMTGMVHLTACASSATFRLREKDRRKLLSPQESLFLGAVRELVEELDANTYATIEMLTCQTDVIDCLHGI